MSSCGGGGSAASTSTCSSSSASDASRSTTLGKDSSARDEESGSDIDSCASSEGGIGETEDTASPFGIVLSVRLSGSSIAVLRYDTLAAHLYTIEDQARVSDLMESIRADTPAFAHAARGQWGRNGVKGSPVLYSVCGDDENWDLNHVIALKMTERIGSICETYGRRFVFVHRAWNTMQATQACPVDIESFPVFVKYSPSDSACRASSRSAEDRPIVEIRIENSTCWSTFLSTLLDSSDLSSVSFLTSCASWRTISSSSSTEELESLVGSDLAPYSLLLVHS